MEYGLDKLNFVKYNYVLSLRQDVVERIEAR